MKSIKISSLLTMVVMTMVIGSVQASEFNNLTYLLDYPEPVGSFRLVFDLPSGQKEFSFILPLVYNMPEIYLTDKLNDMCSPGNPEYNPFFCLVLNQLLNTQALEWINEQWNTNISLLLDILPGKITTRQLPWPINTMGTLIMHDYGIEWPCTWNPQAGSFDLLRLYLEVPVETGPNVSVKQIFDFNGHGAIDRNSGYSIDGLFDYNIGMAIQVKETTIKLYTGILGAYIGQP